MKQISSRGAGLDVHTETGAQELLQGRAQFLGVLEFGSAVGSDEKKGFERFLVQVGRFALDQFDGHDAQGPDIDF